MTDGIIKGDGTSRLIRANLPATYAEFRAAAAAGTLPADVLFNAAGWSQQPDFLNKATLLKDTTAALFGLDANAVPDAALVAAAGAISRLDGAVFDHAATYYWERYDMSIDTDAESVTSQKIYTSYYCWYSDSATIDTDGETIIPVNCSEQFRFTSSGYATEFEQVKGKYLFVAEGSYGSAVTIDKATRYYVPADATVSYASSALTVSKLYKPAVVQSSNSTTVTATDYNAYPMVGSPDATYYYRYSHADKPCLQMMTGTYVGAASAFTLTFDFVPQIVWVYALETSTGGVAAYDDKICPFYWGATSWRPCNVSASAALALSYPATNAVTIPYNSNCSVCNSGTTYCYYAIG